MKTVLLSLLAWILLIGANVNSALQSSGLDAQRLTVAKIRVRYGEAGFQTAAAIYVGNDQQSGYFITAYHTIVPNQGDRIESVEIQFFNSPQFFKAEIVENYDPSLDLGIIKTSFQNVPSQKKLFAKDPAPATAIQIIGHPPSGDWSIWSGFVANENGPHGDSRHFIVNRNRDNSLTHGYSGGAVFDSEGNFLGMHVATTDTYSKEVKSREILNFLGPLRVPTNNFGQSSSKSGTGNQSKPSLPTVEEVDYAIDDLRCGVSPSKITVPNYSVDGTRHLLTQDGKPVNPVTVTDLKELVSKRVIVVHSTTQILRLSQSRFAHLLIMRDGTVKQLVPFNYAVDHVTNEDWKGLSPVKNHTIAIELENAGWLRNKNDIWYDWLEQTVPEGQVVRLTGDIQWMGWHRFTDTQIHTFFRLVCALRSMYPTIVDMIEHGEIDKRAADPGPIFPMKELRTKLFPTKVF